MDEISIEQLIKQQEVSRKRLANMLQNLLKIRGVETYLGTQGLVLVLAYSKVNHSIVLEQLKNFDFTGSDFGFGMSLNRRGMSRILVLLYNLMDSKEKNTYSLSIYSGLEYANEISDQQVSKIYSHFDKFKNPFSSKHVIEVSKILNANFEKINSTVYKDGNAYIVLNSCGRDEFEIYVSPLIIEGE